MKKTKDTLKHIKKIYNEFKKLRKKYPVEKSLKLLRKKGFRFDNNVLYAYIKRKELGGFKKGIKKYYSRTIKREKYEKREKQFKEYIKSLISEYNISRDIEIIKNLLKNVKAPQNMKKSIQYRLNKIQELSSRRERRLKNMAEKLYKSKQKQEKQIKIIEDSIKKMNPKIISEIYKKFKSYNLQLKLIDTEVYKIILKNLKDSRKYKLKNKTFKERKVRYITIMRDLIKNDMRVKEAYAKLIGIPAHALGSV